MSTPSPDSGTSGDTAASVEAGDRREPKTSVLVPLAVTVGMQSLTAFALHSASVYAPIVAPDFNVPPERVSVFVMLAYFVAMVSGLACSGVITRLGPLRTVQIGLLSSGIGLASGAIGVLPMLVATAFLIGLGNGFTGPVSSHILVERAPRRILAFVLAAKQTGVPIGGGIAGAVIPVLALTVGWRYSLLIAAAVYLVVVAALQSLRNEYDARRDRHARLDVTTITKQMRASLEMTWRDPVLRDLALACFAFVMIQWVVLVFMVSLLHVRLGFSLVIAGLIYSAAQITAIPGRLVWGAIADRMGNATALLGWLGVTMALAAGAIGFWTAHWPIEWIVVVSVLFGATGVSWNGLFFSEVARNVKLEDVGRATGGGQFIGFFGGMLGPIVFDLIASTTSSYRAAYLALAALPLLVGLRLILKPAVPRSARRTSP